MWSIAFLFDSLFFRQKWEWVFPLQSPGRSSLVRGDRRASACFVGLGESFQLAELLQNEVSLDDPESSCGSLNLLEVPSRELGCAVPPCCVAAVTRCVWDVGRMEKNVSCFPVVST